MVSGAMRLYDSIGPNPHVVRMFAAEKGLPLERVTVDLLAAENRREPYTSRNVSGTTPALEVDDGTTVCETIAICEYLEERQPEPALIGRDATERAETRMWTRRIDLGIVEPMANGFRATEGRKMFGNRMKLVSPEAGAELKAIARDKLLWLDRQLAGRPYVCGDRFSLADILLFAFLDFGARVGQPIPEGASWAREFHARIGSRHSAKA
jgi:glutathione S-transferase